MAAYIPTRLIGTNSMAGFRRELKKLLKCIVVSTAAEMTTEDINEDFVDLEGRPIPYGVLLFRTLRQYIESLDDTFWVDPLTGVVWLVDSPCRNKSGHIRRLVDIDGTSCNYRDRFVPVNMLTPRLTRWTIMDIINKTPLFVFYKQSEIVVLFNRNKGVMVIDQFKTEIKKILHVHNFEKVYGSFEKMLEGLRHLLYVVGEKIYIDLSIYSEEVKDLGLNPYYVPDVPVVPLSVIENIKKILIIESHGIWANRLPKEYEDKYGFPLDYWTFGFSSVVQLLATMPHIFRLRRFDGIFRLYDMRNRDPAAPGVPVRDRKKVQSLLCLFEDGIDVRYFDSLYCVMYRTRFDIGPMEFESIVQGLSTLVDDGVVLESLDEETYVKLKSPTMARAIPVLKPFLNLKIADPMPREWYPSSVLQPGDLIPRNRYMEVDITSEGGFHIELTAVWSPAQFFCTLTNGCSKQLEDQLNGFYKDFAPRLRMRYNAAVPGLFCVALVNGKYERVLITGLSHTPGHVNVLLIDKGNLYSLSRDCFYYMKTSFQDIPNQALLCYIPNMKPKDNAPLFSDESCKVFKSLIEHKTLFAKVYRLNLKNMEMGIFLIDITDGKELDVRKVMLEGWFGLVTFEKPKCAEDHYATWLLYSRLIL